MLDFGWAELLVIVAVAVLVIGPQDIPKIMYTLGRFARRLQYVRYAITQQFDEVLKAGDIEELRRGVNIEAKSDPSAERDEDEEFMMPLLDEKRREKKND